MKKKNDKTTRKPNYFIDANGRWLEGNEDGITLCVKNKKGGEVLKIYLTCFELGLLLAGKPKVQCNVAFGE